MGVHRGPARSSATSKNPRVASGWRSGWLLATIWLVVAGAASASAENTHELGRPLVRNFTPHDYQGHPLCQAVIQGADGLMYFANNTDALSFDGQEWRSIKLPAESSGIRQFARAADGTIYLGGGGVLGCFSTARGRVEYRSLIGELPRAEQRFSEIFQVLTLGDAVYFATEDRIFLRRDHGFTVIPFPAPANARGVRLHSVDGTIYLTAVGHPLSRLVDGRIEIVADDPVFRENQILSLEPAEAGALLVFTEERGFFQLAAGRVSRATTPLNSWLAGRQVQRALRLTDGSLAVAFAPASGNGGMLFDAAGELRWRLDASCGMLNPAIRDFFPDGEGGLWLGLESGVTRIAWESGVTLFDPVNGLSPAFVVDTVIHDGVRYAATIDGVYRLNPTTAGQAASFERVFNLPVYSLLDHPAGLLARGYTEIFVLTPAGFAAVAKSPIGMGALGAWRHDPDRVWFTSSRGLHSLYHTADGWRDEGAVPGFAEYANGQTEEPDGTLQVSTHSRGLFRFEFGGDRHGPRIVTRILRFDAGLQHYVPLDPANPLPSDRQVDSQIPNQDVPGNEWLTNNSPESALRTIMRAARGGRAALKLPQFVAEATGMIHRMRAESSAAGDVLWVCGANGLVRVDLTRVIRALPPLTVLLRTGDLQAGEKRSQAPDGIDFEFVAPRLQGGGPVLYQTRLTGYDTDWSQWSPERKRTFTNLPGGDYRFEARSRDADGVLSAPAALAFTILPPWWRTWWFLGLAGVAGVGSVAGLTRWQATRALRRRVQLLEAQSAVERERLRLARDLHDEVGSGLGRVILFAGEAARVKGDPAQLDAALGRVRTTAQDLVQHAREIVWAVSPQHDTLASLVERLGDYTVDTLRAAGIACRLDVPDAAAIPAVAIRSDVRHSLFLALKEAVHNCVKYSGATTAEFSLRLAEGSLEITLRDHGRGFVSGERQGSGHGLRNLAIRAEALGGTGAITSEPGRGTTVSLRVPLAPTNLAAP